MVHLQLGIHKGEWSAEVPGTGLAPAPVPVPVPAPAPDRYRYRSGSIMNMIPVPVPVVGRIPCPPACPCVHTSGILHCKRLYGRAQSALPAGTSSARGKVPGL